jgi:hypothetical protein
MNRAELSGYTVFVSMVLLGLFVVIGVPMVGLPLYWVYHQHQEGRAMLAKAEYSKQVLVQEAMSKAEAAKSLADAEVTRAEQDHRREPEGEQGIPSLPLDSQPGRGGEPGDLHSDRGQYADLRGRRPVPSQTRRRAGRRRGLTPV